MTWRPEMAELSLKPVRRNEEYVRQVEGGFRRFRAPCDGYAWSAGEACGFIAESQVQTATVDLAMAKRRRGR